MIDLETLAKDCRLIQSYETSIRKRNKWRQYIIASDLRIVMKMKGLKNKDVIFDGWTHTSKRLYGKSVDVWFRLVDPV
jgi:hypothetical protein